MILLLRDFLLFHVVKINLSSTASIGHGNFKSPVAILVKVVIRSCEVWKVRSPFLEQDSSEMLKKLQISRL